MLTPQEALRQYFGFEQFRSGQEEAIERALKGQHTLLVMPTGSGKSLAYQLPALLLPGLTLIISPLIALMKDQVDSLVAAGLPATYVNSSLPRPEANRRLRAVREGQVKLLYIAPERLRNRAFTQILAKLTISLLGVDEAHCISHWGHDFRPDYLQIGPTWQAMGQPTLLATTATATPTVQQDIVKLLGLKKSKTIVTGFNRPNLTFRAMPAADDRTKRDALRTLLRQIEGRVIVYTATRRNTDEVAEFIKSTVGLPAGAYHAGLERDTRFRIQTDFMADRLPVVVATNAFGMGVDKPDVRAVIHYNLPATVEAYYQEAGRAGRDGLPAECVLLFSPDDQRLQEWLINSDTPTYQDLTHVYHRLAQAATEGEVYFGPPELVEMTGLHPVTIRVVLSELEQAGCIVHLGSQRGYGHWKILPPDETALKERIAAISRRAQIRLELLARILDYAYLTTCRRQFLLAYFGDVSPPKSPRCCDNHPTDTAADLPKAVTPREWFPLIVLETVRSLQHRPVGRTRLAQLLTGSRAKGMHQFGYDQHKFYGKLEALSQPELISLIDALISGRYLRLSGGDRPVLTLTPPGLEALQARSALPVQIPAVEVSGPAGPADPATSPQPRTPSRPDTTTQTFNLFQAGLTPTEIATERGLAESTIYTHLARLIGEDKVELARLVPAEVEAQVLQGVEKVGRADRLTPIKAVLPETISFEQIKCVLAAHPELPRAEQPPEPAETPAASPSDSQASLSEKPASTPAAPATSPDAVILEVAAGLDGILGRTGLAQFLAGSQAAWLESFTSYPGYGQLAHLSQKAVLNIIDALITDGQLQVKGNFRPKVIVAKPDQPPQPAQDPPPAARASAGAGEGPTASKSATAITSNHKNEGLASPESPDSEVQDSLEPDPALLERLRTWRTEQAKTQQVPPYVIFSNKVLEAIAARQPTTLEKLEEIPGVGPVKLEKYGQRVIALVTGAEKKQADKAERPASSPLQLKERLQPQTPPSGSSQPPETESIRDRIITVVTDLDGLLTPEGVAALLTAAPEEVVPFSDHPLFATLHNKVTPDEVKEEIGQVVTTGQLVLNRHRRLVLP